MIDYLPPLVVTVPMKLDSESALEAVLTKHGLDGDTSLTRDLEKWREGVSIPSDTSGASVGLVENPHYRTLRKMAGRALDGKHYVLVRAQMRATDEAAEWAIAQAEELDRLRSNSSALPIPFCEPCNSYHPSPKDEAHHLALMCSKPWERETKCPAAHMVGGSCRECGWSYEKRTSDGPSEESVGDLLKRAAARMRASKRGEVQAHVKLPEGWAEFTLPEHRPPPSAPRSGEGPQHYPEDIIEVFNDINDGKITNASFSHANVVMLTKDHHAVTCGEIQDRYDFGEADSDVVRVALREAYRAGADRVLGEERKPLPEHVTEGITDEDITDEDRAIVADFYKNACHVEWCEYDEMMLIYVAARSRLNGAVKS